MLLGEEKALRLTGWTAVVTVLRLVDLADWLEALVS